MSDMLIFSTHPLHSEVQDQLKKLGQLKISSAPTQEAIIAESGAAEIIVVRAPIAAEIITREPRLRALIRHGAGLDMIPVDVATEAGVLVANVPGANAVTVAEHVIWSSLSLLRKYPKVSAEFRRDGWAVARANSDSGREISGKTLGIVGMGNIGKALFRIAHFGFGMKVISHTRSPAGLPEGVTAVALENLLKQADIVVLCCPLTDQTRGLIGAAQITMMRRGAILVNVSRGPVVDQQPLLQALQSNRLGGAVLDVFDQPTLPTDHPYMRLSNVILTPHMAGVTEESMWRMGMGVVQEVRRVLAGDVPLNFVNPEVLPRYRTRFE